MQSGKSKDDKKKKEEAEKKKKEEKEKKSKDKKEKKKQPAPAGKKKKDPADTGRVLDKEFWKWVDTKCKGTSRDNDDEDKSVSHAQTDQCCGSFLDEEIACNLGEL